MFLFIFESIGTSELLLIGMVALIFLGPRKMPEMAKKIGKMMAEFRGTANEFKETWQREVNFDEEIKAFDINNIEGEVEKENVSRVTSIEVSDSPSPPTVPEIKEIDPAKFQGILPLSVSKNDSSNVPKDVADKEKIIIPSDDKKNWL